METFDGDLILMSLARNRYLRLSQADGKVFADSQGPRPDGQDGVRFRFRPASLCTPLRPQVASRRRRPRHPDGIERRSEPLYPASMPLA